LQTHPEAISTLATSFGAYLGSEPVVGIEKQVWTATTVDPKLTVLPSQVHDTLTSLGVPPPYPDAVGIVYALAGAIITSITYFVTFGRFLFQLLFTL